MPEKKKMKLKSMHTLLQKNLDSAHRAIHYGKRRMAIVQNEMSDSIAFSQLPPPACLAGQKPSPAIDLTSTKTRAAPMASVANP